MMVQKHFLELHLPFNANENGCSDEFLLLGILPVTNAGKIFGREMGCKNVVGYSTLMTSIMTALSPLAYKITFSTMVAARFLIGFFGVTNFAIDMGMVDYYSL